MSNPLIARFIYPMLYDFSYLLAQVGTFRFAGVAVASQVLCTSTTLNKRKRISLLPLHIIALSILSVNIHFGKYLKVFLAFCAQRDYNMVMTKTGAIRTAKRWFCTGYETNRPS